MMGSGFVLRLIFAIGLAIVGNTSLGHAQEDAENLDGGRLGLLRRLLGGSSEEGKPADQESAEEADRLTAVTVYRLIPDDVVEITVHGEDELATSTRLNKNGEATLILLGPLDLAGLTLEEAARLVRDAYMIDYLVDPTVSVVIKEYGKANFAVLGEVKTPGYYFFAGNEKIDLLQAIAMAGSYTRLGSPKKVFVRRTVDGEEKVFRLNAKSMASGDEKPFPILSGDVITIGQSIW